jgi:hypothetical protein
MEIVQHVYLLKKIHNMGCLEGSGVPVLTYRTYGS